MDNQQIARIDRYTCKFENPVMERLKYILYNNLGN